MCQRILDRLETLRLLTPKALLALPEEETEIEYVQQTPVSFTTFREELDSGDSLVVVQGFFPSWRFPRYFCRQGVGHVYADGFVLETGGNLCEASDEQLWLYR